MTTKPETNEQREVANEKTTDPRDLGKLLRFFGGAAILAAMGTFLLQRWGVGEDWVRYLVLLGVTLLLAASGVVGGLRYGESRGARSLIGIVLSSVPIHFAITGGLLYSRYAVDDLGVAFSGATRWVAHTPVQALFPAALALVVLTPAVWLGARVMFRSNATRTTLALLVSTLLIWVPAREPVVVAALAAIGFGAACWAEQKAARTGALGQTLEARWMRALVFAPPVLILGRQVVVYGPHYALIGAFGLGAAVLMLYLAKRLEPNVKQANPLSTALETATLFPLTVALGCFAYAIYDHAAVPTALCPAIVGVGLFACSAWVAHTRFRSWALVLATGSTICALGLLGSGLLGGGFLASLCAIAIGAVVASAGYLSRKAMLIAIGGTMAAPALVLHFLATLEDGAFLGWGGLVIAGFASILGAAAVERIFNAANRTETRRAHVHV